MNPRTTTAIISLVAFLGFSPALNAQSTKTPTLEEILQRLEANLNRYDKLVPSFFCDEHAMSKVEPSSHNQDTITDSIFRLKRNINPDHTTTLVESREIKNVNGKPATSQNMDGPSLLRGAFEGGLDIVSLDQTACMNYALQKIDKNRPADPYIVRFTTVLTTQNSANCLLDENSKGRVFIDPVSMQITHLELTTPRHTIIPRGTSTSPVVGRRVLTVDYAPVLLGGGTFWMPSTITSRSISGSGTFHTIIWSYQATYSNYHKMEVTTRILTGSEVHAP